MEGILVAESEFSKVRFPFTGCELLGIQRVLMRKWLFILLAGLALALFCLPYIKVGWKYMDLKINGKKTISDRLAEYGEIVEKRVLPYFQKQGIHYPPAEITFLALKQERVLQVYSKNSGEIFKFIHSYPILAASGKIGPKLKEGDRQVPEGIYGIELLNPNSLFHLSLKVGYPNKFDKIVADRENRNNLGGDIMIHGNEVSIGCIAVGDEAAEDLFVLAAKTGIEKIKVIISPIDFRVASLPSSGLESRGWVNELYKSIQSQLQEYPLTLIAKK